MSKSKKLTLKDVKALSCSATEQDVELKKWGGIATIRPMSPAETDKFLDGQGDGTPFTSQVQIVFKCMLEPKFESVADVADLRVGMVSEAFLAIQALSGVGEDDDQIKKNSPETTGDDSPTA